MSTWVLVIVLFGNSDSTTTINGFKSQKTCQAAEDKLFKVIGVLHTTCLEVK